MTSKAQGWMGFMELLMMWWDQLIQIILIILPLISIRVKPMALMTQLLACCELGLRIQAPANGSRGCNCLMANL